MGTAPVISWRHGEAPIAPGLGAGPDDPPDATGCAWLILVVKSLTGRGGLIFDFLDKVESKSYVSLVSKMRIF